MIKKRMVQQGRGERKQSPLAEKTSYNQTQLKRGRMRRRERGRGRESGRGKGGREEEEEELKNARMQMHS
jgi:hypothetical protein